MARSCAISQPNYIPWKGYFDLIRSVDEFVFYDTAQYTKGDWRNRNRLKTPQGTCWLTLPVSKEAHRLRIAEVMVLNNHWKRKHVDSWQAHYARAASASEMLPLVRRWYDECTTDRLVSVCTHFVGRISEFLGIQTRTHLSSEWELPHDRNAKLVSICKSLDCNRYVSGPAARAYLDEQVFGDAGIEVEWFDYSGYPEYDQPHPPFRHDVSVLDLLLCTGSEAIRYLDRTGS